MRKQTTKPQSQTTVEPRVLSASELQQASGGVMKTRHDTIKNTIGNIR